MRLIVTPPTGRCPHFYHLWLRRIDGMHDNGGEHCIACLRAKRDARLTAKNTGETRLDLDPLGLLPPEPGSPVYYVCGVSPKGWGSNLHIALVEDAQGSVEVAGHDGTRVRAEGARAVTIPDVPDGFEARNARQTRCRNWRFAQGWFRPSAFPSILAPT